ncbi:MAG: aldehyde dehydrogenase family protein, partial [Thermoleophilaceae bacterium]|nr:aldehyde dehydrogenase family protein [Thermoleophilaceae bacterium]
YRPRRSQRRLSPQSRGPQEGPRHAASQLGLGPPWKPGFSSAGEQVPGEGELLAVENPANEETVAPIVPVSSLDEAIELANGTRFGLGANVYTRDLATAVRCMREIRAGTVWINDPLTDNDAGPFGGFKQSGLGRELGQEGLEAFQETKHVHMETRIEAEEWWYPYGS